jgi:rhodanese-related sulfurtransferase
MKYLLILFAVLIYGCQPTAQEAEKVPTLDKATVVSYQNLDVPGFKEGMKQNDVVILDVRTPEEIANGKIADAVELDFYASDFADKLLAMDKDKEYFVYCKKGGRSAKAARLMIKNGFEKVYNLEGGYTEWKKSDE